MNLFSFPSIALSSLGRQKSQAKPAEGIGFHHREREREMLKEEVEEDRNQREPCSTPALTLRLLVTFPILY